MPDVEPGRIQERVADPRIISNPRAPYAIEGIATRYGIRPKEIARGDSGKGNNHDVLPVGRRPDWSAPIAIAGPLDVMSIMVTFVN
jgi:hypothetical protein